MHPSLICIAHGMSNHWGLTLGNCWPFEPSYVVSTKVGLYGSPVPWGQYAYAGIYLKFLWTRNFPGYFPDSPLNIILKRYQMVGLDLSHTRLLCHVLFWLTEMVLFSNVSVYSIITCLDPSIPLYFIRLLGSDFFLIGIFLRIKLFQKREVILKGKITALVAPEGFPSCQCVWFHARSTFSSQRLRACFSVGSQ